MEDFQDCVGVLFCAVSEIFLNLLMNCIFGGFLDEVSVKVSGRLEGRVSCELVDGYLVRRRLPMTMRITSRNTEQESTISEMIICFRIVQFFFILMQQTRLMLF